MPLVTRCIFAAASSWAILMPSLIVLAGVVVRFGYAFASHNPLRTTDLLSVAVRSLPWAFTVSAVRFATNSLGSNEDLVSKVYFPKEIIPISAVLACAFDVGVASLVLCAGCLAGAGYSTRDRVVAPTREYNEGVRWGRIEDASRLELGERPRCTPERCEEMAP